ncbi:hypothetical protein E1B28_005197 [Marasmius oreades]|uniref:Cystathionine gamma-synthase n=1 Tax=Marasmius oreades TaxID=181124 RepID=A0A9P7V046_9AGAR|nr:uncharacterized protein E1B28_005197 [Marasmius oreades]KAG7097884.1 hypothetical protein E1B28_005197 [Marasmius oreades]
MHLRETLASPPGSAPMGTPAVVDPHTILASIPRWRDVLELTQKNAVYMAKFKVGYPRFFMHNSVRKLTDVCLEAVNGVDGELMTMVFPTPRILHECVSYLSQKGGIDNPQKVGDIRVVHFDITGPSKVSMSPPDSIHVVLFPPELEETAKAFWLNAGMGISSRHAEYLLRRLEEGDILMVVQRPSENRLNKYSGALSEKVVMRQRIAGLLNGGDGDQPASLLVEAPDIGKRPIQPEDVFLYPSGMSAIWHAHQLTRTLFPNLKCAAFGFLYVDSMNVYQNWGEGLINYFDDPDATLKELDQNPPKISALYTELPSNPLLKSPNLSKIRNLADQHGFLVVVDQTVGNFINVDVIKYVDIVCTSLSKMFSGSANVLGGSLAINPNSRHYDSMRAYLLSEFVDDFYHEDAIVMEYNSRDFAKRVRTANANTMEIATLLRSRSISYSNSSKSHAPNPRNLLAVKDVYFPRWVTRDEYEICRRPYPDSNNYGQLITITFVSTKASEAFYDALQCVKAPSIGTNFTLAVPYVVLAHYHERDVVAKHGLDEALVRLSVGIEEQDVVIEWVETALEAAEKTLEVADNQHRLAPLL